MATFSGTVLLAGPATVSASGQRTRTTSASITGTASISSQGAIVKIASASISAVGSVNAFATTIGALFPQTLQGVASVSVLGGKFLSGTATLGGVLSTVTVGTDIKLDPFRIFVVPTESRTINVEQETRKQTIISESRVNKVTQETRQTAVDSETRKFVVNPGQTLVDVFGVRDIRKG